MTTILYAQPYDTSAEGFYFRSEKEYLDTYPTIRNNCGTQVEEFEVQFIDGESIDAQLAEALQLHQGNAFRYIEVVEEWDDYQKTKYIIAIGENSYSFDLNNDNIDDLGIDIYPDMTMRDLAIEFIDEGLFSDIPQPIANYIDYSAIARDLSIDYSETTIAGENVIYRCA